MSLILNSLREHAPAADAAARAVALMRRLYPICRSITGNGVRRTLDLIGEVVSLQRHEVSTGTPVFDWEVPKEWNVRDAFVADSEGRRLIDFRQHNLHLVSYSAPVRRRMSREELEPHLHSLPEHPDWIPYRTSYYKEDWGFCLRHRDRVGLGDGPFNVVIDSDLAPGHLSYAEALVEGSTAAHGLVYTHTCHPSLANDNLTGMSVCAVLAGELARFKPRLTWRFIFGPGTIGSLTWLARNEAVLPHVCGGLVVGLLGDSGSITYKRSRRGQCTTDRAAELVLRQRGLPDRCMDFEPYGYDERQFCSPGFDLPVGRLTRSPNSGYAEYHSSADDLDLVSTDRIAESMRVLAQILAVLDGNRVPVNQSPKGEPRLGRRGLYGSIGGHAPREFEQALLWVLSLGDGTRDLIDIALRSGLDFELVEQASRALEQAGLVESDLPEPCATAGRGTTSRAVTTRPTLATLTTRAR